MSALTHCTVHNCTGHSEAQCWRSALDPDDFTQCEMRPALVVLRDEEGNWPIWFRAFVKAWWIRAQRSDYEGRWSREFMDALAAASQEQQ